MWTVPADIFSHQPPREETGILELGVGISGGRSVVKQQYFTRALKVVRTHYLDDTGQAYVTIVNPGGGYVGGDAYRIEVEVEDGASLLLTDQSAVKVYRTPHDYVVQNMHVKVGDCAVLEYIPDQLILYRDADYRQQITADVHPNGSLLMSEIITPGWSPDGGKFLYDQAFLRNVVTVGGKLEIIDNLKLNPTASDFRRHREYVMAGRTHISTVICLEPGLTDDHIDQVRDLVRSHEGGESALWGSVSRTNSAGFIVRALANRTEELLHLTTSIANFIRAEFRGQGPILLRKY